MDEQVILRLIIAKFSIYIIAGVIIVAACCMPIMIFMSNEKNTTTLTDITNKIQSNNVKKLEKEKEYFLDEQGKIKEQKEKTEKEKEETQDNLFKLKYILLHRMYPHESPETEAAFIAKLTTDIELKENELKDIEDKLNKINEDFYCDFVYYSNTNTIDRKILIAMNTIKLLKYGQTKENGKYLAEDEIDEKYINEIISLSTVTTEWIDIRVETTVKDVNKQIIGYDGTTANVEYESVKKERQKIKKKSIYLKDYEDIYKVLQLTEEEKTNIKNYLSYDPEFEDNQLTSLKKQAEQKGIIHIAAISTILNACEELKGYSFFPGGKSDMEDKRKEYLQNNPIKKRSTEEYEGVPIYSEQENKEYEKCTKIEKEEEESAVSHQAGFYASGKKISIKGIDSQGFIEHVFNKVGYKLQGNIGENIFLNSVPVSEDKLIAGDFAFVTDPRQQGETLEENNDKKGVRINNDEWNRYQSPYTFSNESCIGIYSGKRNLQGKPLFYLVSPKPLKGYPSSLGTEDNASIETGKFGLYDYPTFNYYRRYFNYSNKLK